MDSVDPINYIGSAYTVIQPFTPTIRTYLKSRIVAARQVSFSLARLWVGDAGKLTPRSYLQPDLKAEHPW